MAPGSPTDAGLKRIQVHLRVRPPLGSEVDWLADGKCREILRREEDTPDSQHSIIIDKSNKPMKFDHVFRERADQREIFERAALPTLDHVFGGFCGAILAYGQTGAGKTHTMLGYGFDSEKKGIIPRCGDYIFDRIKREKDNTRFSVKLSYVQIYMDKFHDLFDPEAPEVNINHQADRVQMPGITFKDCPSPEEFIKLFKFGDRHRMVRKTRMNPTSSRGHAALIVNLQMVGYDGSGTKEGKLVLVDLAGYERFEQTGITQGIAAQEAKKINSSLLALGSVVNALADQSKTHCKDVHIPYRNSKLTRLLKDCLGGKSLSTILLTIGPCDKYRQETQGTLHFGWRAMAVKVEASAKSFFDPMQATLALKERLQKATERIGSMVAWWSKTDPGNFKKYSAKYGEPELGGELPEIDTGTMQRLATVTADTMPRIEAVEEPFIEQTVVGAVLPPEEDDQEAPEALKQVRREFRRAQEEHLKQQQREAQELAIQQRAELEAAVKSGVDDATLINLQEDHVIQRTIVAEGARELQAQINEEKEEEEMKALVQSSREHYASFGSSDGQRVAEVLEHLEQTSKSRDQLLQQVFDYVFHLERKVNEAKNELGAMSAAVKIGLEDRDSDTRGSPTSTKEALMERENVALKEKLARAEQRAAAREREKGTKDRERERERGQREHRGGSREGGEAVRTTSRREVAGEGQQATPKWSSNAGKVLSAAYLAKPTQVAPGRLSAGGHPGHPPPTSSAHSLVPSPHGHPIYTHRSSAALPSGPPRPELPKASRSTGYLGNK